MIINDSFFDIEDMIEEIVESEYFDDFYIVGRHESIKEVLKELFIGTELIPHYIEFSNPIWDGYDKEFLITHIDEDLYCEKAKTEKGYLEFDTKVIFLLPDCSEECVEAIKNKNPDSVIFKVDFLIGDSDDDDECEDIDDDGTFYNSVQNVDGENRTTSVYVNGDKHGFVKNWQNEKDGIHNSKTFSFYSDDLEETARIAKIFDIEIG